MAGNRRRPSVGMVVAGSLSCGDLAILSQGGGRLVFAVSLPEFDICARLRIASSFGPSNHAAFGSPSPGNACWADHGLRVASGHHVGLPLPLVFAAIAASAAPGLVMGLADLRKCWRHPVRHGWWYLAAIALIGLAYYLPKALHDATPSMGGAFNGCISIRSFRRRSPR